MTVKDGAGATDVDAKTISVSYSVVITSAKAASAPFRLKVKGSGFKSGCTVKINSVAVPTTQFSSASQVVAKGSGLKAMLPKGQTVQITVSNADGKTSAPFPLKR